MGNSKFAKRLAGAICIVACMMLLCGENAMAQTHTTVDAESGIEQLEMPSIPDSLSLPSDRASFLLLHFWDNMDFSDQRYAKNEAFIEQNFVNFISIMPIAETQSIAGAVKELYERAAADSTLAITFDTLAETYLSDLESPMRNEDVYIAYLDGRLAAANIDEAARLRSEFHRAAAMRNRPGTQAADFAVADRAGREFMFSDSVKSAENPTLLIFYDPDCEDCHTTMGKITQDELFKQLNIVAVYAGDDAEHWLEDAAGLPRNWTVARAVTPIEEEEVFDIPVTPTIYLIDDEMKVVLKNAVLEQVEELLKN